MSRLDDAREKEHEDLAMDILSRAVELWQRGGSGEPNELTQIKYEPSFSKAMRSRADFIKLVEQ
ncbi:MAG: hypothetical protein IID46_15615 [Planctomycetes bacterium]|nr:hypothetical protein [Planctomycetota bacterium]